MSDRGGGGGGREWRSKPKLRSCSPSSPTRPSLPLPSTPTPPLSGGSRQGCRQTHRRSHRRRGLTRSWPGAGSPPSRSGGEALRACRLVPPPWPRAANETMPWTREGERAWAWSTHARGRGWKRRSSPTEHAFQTRREGKAKSRSWRRSRRGRRAAGSTRPDREWRGVEVQALRKTRRWKERKECDGVSARMA